MLVERGEKVTSDPPGLEESERKFVEKLREYARGEAASLATKEIFLLRNLGRGRGIGFFTNAGFYPDFILWVKEGEAQRIVFVEPHGMLNEESFGVDGKVHLYAELKRLSEKWGKAAGLENIDLDSFIVSATPYAQLRTRYYTGDWTREQFRTVHILFTEDDYVNVLL